MAILIKKLYSWFVGAAKHDRVQPVSLVGEVNAEWYQLYESDSK